MLAGVLAILEPCGLALWSSWSHVDWHGGHLGAMLAAWLRMLAAWLRAGEGLRIQNSEIDDSCTFSTHFWMLKGVGCQACQQD